MLLLECSAAVQPLSEADIAATLAGLRAKSKAVTSLARQSKRGVRPPSNNTPRPLLTPLPYNDPTTVPVWETPEQIRQPGVDLPMDYGYHLSLDDIFPGTGLGEAWDTKQALRTDLRLALRADLFKPPPSWNAKRIQCATGLGSACMVSWRVEADCTHFTSAFARHGVALDGYAFLHGLGRICGERPHGSLIDIVPLDRRVTHSWHQDCGLDSNTVLLGFPPCNGYVGGGVFSNHVKLSHPLRPNRGDIHGQVVQLEQFDPPLGRISDEFVVRPMYSSGREVWVSNDKTHVHSTPDRQRRECLWRFM